jgi:beta-lactam-binding protein with PASTA domain
MLTLVIPACCVAITACGQAITRAPAPRVRLQLRSPADGTGVPTPSITVSGTVSPARAEVLVLGQRATVKPDGSFSTRVSLRDGVNLIDVLASLPHANGAMAAVRVERFALVAVPQVLGLTPRAARAALRAAGLVPKVRPISNPISSFLPLPNEVCSATPQPGAQIAPGSTVTLRTSNLCELESFTSGSQTSAANGPEQQVSVATSPPGPPPADAPARGHGHGPADSGPPGQSHGHHGDQGNGSDGGGPGRGHGQQGDQGNSGGD